MGKFVDKRRKFQSRHEIDKRESKALAAAEAKQDLLGMEHLEGSTDRMREYLRGTDITFLDTPGYWIDAIVPPGMFRSQRQPDFGYFRAEPVEIPAYAMDPTLIIIDSISPELPETIGWGGPRTLNISSIESMGTYSPKGVEVRVVGDGEFTDEEPVCPHCGRRHGRFNMDGLFDYYFSSLRDIMRSRANGGAIDGEFHRVQENNLLTHDPKDPE